MARINTWPSIANLAHYSFTSLQNYILEHIAARFGTLTQLPRKVPDYQANLVTCALHKKFR
jgi:hypothetical protein